MMPVWRGESIPRWALGTAQLGTPYGIANVSGPVSLARAGEVIATALDCGVRMFDTAQAYGRSEEFLGMALRHNRAADEVRVISKLHPEISPADPAAVLESIQRSVDRLGAPLWGLLLHRPESLNAWGRGLGDALREAQRQSLVKYLGASVYTVAEARESLRHAEMDFIQVPASAWDQRMLREGVFEFASARGKLCFVRSVFLQGLLTLTPEESAARLGFARAPSARWTALAEERNMSREELAARGALTLSAPLVVGAETAQQVRVNEALFSRPPLAAAELDLIYQRMADVLNERVLDPRRWGSAS